MILFIFKIICYCKIGLQCIFIKKLFSAFWILGQYRFCFSFVFVAAVILRQLNRIQNIFLKNYILRAFDACDILPNKDYCFFYLKAALVVVTSGWIVVVAALFGVTSGGIVVLEWQQGEDEHKCTIRLQVSNSSHGGLTVCSFSLLPYT